MTDSLSQYCLNCETQANTIEELRAANERWVIAFKQAEADATGRIEALQADKVKLREALAPFVDFWEWDTVKTYMDYPVSQCFTPATFLRAVKTFHETSEPFTRSSDT